MKLVILVGALMLVQGVFACDKGCEEMGGVCACDQAPEHGALAAPPVGVVSDEKPSRHPEPAYERGDVKVDMPQSLIATDADLDREKSAAEDQGKKAAGVK